MSRSIDKIPAWKKLTAGTAAALGMSGLFLTAGCTSPDRPVAAATATQSGEINKNQENWADLAASVDMYPDVESAASYLMGGSDGKGLYSELLAKAGRRGEDTTVTVDAPHDAIIALFGTEPEGGYPESIRSMIKELNEDYDRFVHAYASTKDTGTAVSCTTTFTEVEAQSEHTVTGIIEQTCENVGAIMNTKNGSWDWKGVLTLTLDQQVDSSDKNVWVIVDAEDGEVLEG